MDLICTLETFAFTGLHWLKYLNGKLTIFEVKYIPDSIFITIKQGCDIVFIYLFWLDSILLYM